MTWFGLTYGILDGLLLLAVFACLYSLFGARVLLTFAGTTLFYCSGLITVGQFEPHQPLTDKFLERGRFPYRYRVIGTKLWIASRQPPEQLPAFAGLLETTQRP
jgi:hypothetical protein